jgi:hypothetical protein
MKTNAILAPSFYDLLHFAVSDINPLLQQGDPSDTPLAGFSQIDKIQILSMIHEAKPMSYLTVVCITCQFG